MLGLRPSDTSSSWCRWWLGWRRHARVYKPFCGKSLDLQFQSFTIVLLTTYLYWIKGILRGYAIRSGRRPSGSQRPGRTQVRPAAADFPRDVCLTVSRNHAVFLLYAASCVPPSLVSWFSMVPVYILAIFIFELCDRDKYICTQIA